MVGFEVTLPANSATALTVLLLPGKTAASATPPVPELRRWR
jgi:hypothetical protein